MSDPMEPAERVEADQAPAEGDPSAASPLHDLDRSALVSGVVFTALGLVFLLDTADWFDWDVELRWIWPILLIGLGLAGLVANARRPG